MAKMPSPAIGALAQQAGERGVEMFLLMLATLSINLGIVNLLPIPILDGGHLVLFGDGCGEDGAAFVDLVVDECGLDSEESEGEPAEDPEEDHTDAGEERLVLCQVHAN